MLTLSGILFNLYKVVALDLGWSNDKVWFGGAGTLMALPPVIVLPISYFAFKEKIGWQAIAGTTLAIAGVAILFLAWFDGADIMISMNMLKTLLYMGSLHGFFTFYFPYQLSVADKSLFEFGVFRYLAFPLWLIGTLIIIWCSIDIIRKGRGTPAHVDPPKILIVNGLYRHVRNPIYFGALLVQLGYIVWFGSGLMMIYFLLSALAFHILIVFIEEPILRNTFGAAYDEYAKSVPRWIPRIDQAK